MNELIDNIMAGPAVEKQTQHAKLTLISDLLDALHRNDILYCHWKSNEHLAASMTGDTDLDVLFDVNQKENTIQLLSDLGFKRFVSIKEKEYKDIEDYLGLDIESGKLVHVHAHFRLTMGEQYLKGYQLNLEDKILDSRIFDPEFGAYCSLPAFELVLLYIREALKLRTRDRLMMSLKNRIHYTENILKEYRWLKERRTDEEIASILTSLFPGDSAMYGIMTGDFTRVEISKLASILKPQLKHNRLYSPTQALLLRWYRELSVKVARKSAQLLHLPILSKRVNPRGGLVIAVIGADGSGKSTAIADLENTLKQKLDIYKIYFGRGDGRVSWPRRMLNKVKSVVAPSSKKGKKIRTEKSGFEPKRGFIATVFKCIEALMVANEKSSNLKQMQAAKAKGMVVICDRFPQNQLMGYNDGPLLHHFSTSKNILYRTLAKAEARIYAQAQDCPPDILIKLVADAHVVEARKPGETSIEMLKTKIAGVKQLRFKESCKVVTIDATQPLQTVLTTIRQHLWENCR